MPKKDPSREASAPQPAAVTYAFDGEDKSDPLCPVVRHDVDAVLNTASDGAITATTPNEHLLSAYMWPQVIEKLYLALNVKLGKYPGFTPFAPDDIKDDSSVGDVRKGSYDHCHITCSHV